MNKNKGLVAGFDEAGRGPVLGPMVLCGVLLSPSVFEEFHLERVRDSKKISPNRREELAELITERAEEYEVIEVSASEIDQLRLKEDINLNEIEALSFARLINKLNPPKAYIDSAASSEENFARMIQKHLQVKTELIVEHEADSNYIPVSAASIIAKVVRDERIEELKQRYGELGSGYPADERTINFLEKWVKKHRELPDFARKSWKTSQRILKKLENG